MRYYAVYLTLKPQRKNKSQTFLNPKQCGAGVFGFNRCRYTSLRGIISMSAAIYDRVVGINLKNYGKKHNQNISVS